MKTLHVLILLVALTGCRQETVPAPPRKAAPSVTAPEPSETKNSQQVPKVTTGATNPGPAKASGDGLSLDDHLAEILALEQEGDFAKALRLCRTLRSKFSRGDRADELVPLLARLPDSKRSMPELMFAVRTLSSADPSESGTANRRILAAGDTGRQTLRRAVENETDEVAGKALELLIKLNDERIAGACFRRLRARPETTLRSACMKYLSDHYAQLSTHRLPALYEHAVTRDTVEERDEFLGVLRQRIRGELDDRSLAAVYRRVAGDSDFSARHLAGFLGFIYQVRTRRIDEELNEWVGDVNAMVSLREYARRAAESANADIAAWGARSTRALAAQESGRLEVGRVGVSMFKDPDGAQLAARGWKIEGQRGLRLEPTPELLALHEGDYSLSIWINPTRKPSDETPADFWGIVKKIEWQMGLVMDAEGRLSFLHFLGDGTAYVKTTSAATVEAGRWTHAVVTVNRLRGTANLFVDGRFDSTAEFEAGAEVAVEVTPEQVCLALDLPVGAAKPFQGSIDDLRLYDRPLPESDVKALYSIGQAWE